MADIDIGVDDLEAVLLAALRAERDGNALGAEMLHDLARRLDMALAGIAAVTGEQTAAE